MTEQEWLVCKDPQEMIRFLTSSAETRYDRKLVLFAIACCLRVKHLFDADFLLTLEKVAWWIEHPRKTPVTREDIEWVQACGWNQSSEVLPWTEQVGILREIIGNPFRPVELSDCILQKTVCDCCNGSNRVFIDGSSPCKYCNERGWFAVQGKVSSHIKEIAQQIYDTQDYAGMPILADAMEEAGCKPTIECPECEGTGSLNLGLADGICDCTPRVWQKNYWRGSGYIPHPILEHLRGNHTHVRGCWALDLILGKE